MPFKAFVSTSAKQKVERQFVNLKLCTHHDSLFPNSHAAFINSNDLSGFCGTVLKMINKKRSSTNTQQTNNFKNICL